MWAAGETESKRKAWPRIPQKFLGGVDGRRGLSSSDFWLVWLGTVSGAVGREDVKMENYKMPFFFSQFDKYL